MSKNINNFSDEARNRIVDSFNQQTAMTLIKANIQNVEAGYVEIHMPYWDGILQQHGYIHGGIVGMIADSAAGYAAMTTVPLDKEVLTVEYKINMVAPTKGDKVIAKGSVIRAGRTLITTKAEVYCYENGQEKLSAVMQQTIMTLEIKS